MKPARVRVQASVSVFPAALNPMISSAAYTYTNADSGFGCPAVSTRIPLEKARL